MKGPDPRRRERPGRRAVRWYPIAGRIFESGQVYGPAMFGNALLRYLPIGDLSDLGPGLSDGVVPINSAFNSPRDRGLLHDFAAEELLGPDYGYAGTFGSLTDHSQNSFGNLEVLPRAPGTWGDSHGHIYHGDGLEIAISGFLSDQSLQGGPRGYGTSWLWVQHVDEVMSVQMTGPGEFRVILASPAMAIEILESDLAVVYEGALWNWRDVPIGRTADWLLTEYRLANELAQVRINAIRNDLAGRVPIVEVPVFFAGVVITDPVAGEVVTDAVAALPDMVNMLNVNGTLIVPNPFDARFRARFIAETGTTPNWIDCLEYHWQGGQVHCGTNTRRTPSDEMLRWWERLPIRVP